MQWCLTTKKFWTKVQTGCKPGTKEAEYTNVAEERNTEALALKGLKARVVMLGGDAQTYRSKSQCCATE